MIILRRLGIECAKQNLDEDILKAYIGYLIQGGRVEQVAWYAGQLSKPNQVEVFSRFMMTVRNEEDRKYCLKMGLEHDLPMEEIRVLVCDNLLQMEEEESSEEDEDANKIRALDWLLFDPVQPVDALVQTNKLIRFFVASQKVEHAHSASQKIPQDLQNELTSVDIHYKEYVCLKTYITAKLSFSDWFEHFHKGRPKKPESLTDERFTNRIANQEKEKIYQSDLER